MKNAITYMNDTQAQVTKAFAKNAQIFGTEEFKLWREYKALYPDAVMVCKTIKKAANKKTTTKNMTYENMAAYIKTQDNAIVLMAEFRREREKSKISANPYRSVLAWFKQKFTDINSYMDFFAELAEKEAEERENNLYTVPAPAVNM